MNFTTDFIKIASYKSYLRIMFRKVVITRLELQSERHNSHNGSLLYCCPFMNSLYTFQSIEKYDQQAFHYYFLFIMIANDLKVQLGLIPYR